MVVFDRQAYNAGLLLPTKLEKQKEGYQIGPLWLRPLLTAKFFTICQVHGESNRNECNLYCLDCVGQALCSSCNSQHRDHHVVQIRRSSYHDVVRVSELQKVLDLAGVQTYIINSARVVFLNARPQPRHAKGVTKTCEICDRSLLDAYRYCSIGCKLTGIRRHNDMTFHLQPKSQQHMIANAIVDAEMGDVLDNSQQEKPSSPPPPAPPLPTSAPTRSSVTSEDTASSGGGQSSNSKRTRSSRKAAAAAAAAAATSSPLKKRHEEKQPEQDEEWESPPAATSSDMDMSSVLQKSLGTLKLHPDDAKATATVAALSPPTPPPTRTAKRRKGTPHRAPMGL